MPGPSEDLYCYEANKSPWLVWVTKGTYFNTFDVDFINILALFLVSATIGREEIAR